jgi:hypothetical protein
VLLNCQSGEPESLNLLKSLSITVIAFCGFVGFCPNRFKGKAKMQLSFLGEFVNGSQAEPAPPDGPLAQPIDLKQSKAKLDQGNCRVCGRPIQIIGLDASLCSNPSRSCGSGGWVFDLLAPRGKGRIK